MNWCSVFPKISYFREGMGNRTKPFLLAVHVIVQLGESDIQVPGNHWHLCTCMYVCAWKGQEGQKQSPTPPSVTSRGTEQAESQEDPCGLCCNFPHNAEEREGLSEGSPRLTSNHIHGEDLAQKIY